MFFKTFKVDVIYLLAKSLSITDWWLSTPTLGNSINADLATFPDDPKCFLAQSIRYPVPYLPYDGRFSGNFSL